MFKFWKRKKNKHIVGTNNIITVIDEKGNECIVDKIKGITININGNNNKIVIYTSTPPFKNCNINILGENNSATIYYPSKNVNNLNISIYSSNSQFLCGKKFGCQGCNILLNDDNNRIVIGDNCMFSWGIQIISSDGHSIYDKVTKKLLNSSGSIKIGNHCWIGSDVKILKNVELADNIICGANSLVTKSCLIPNTVISGMPAKIIKENVAWHGLPPSKFNSDIV